MTALASATVRDALEGATGALAAAGVEGPRLDAELLLAAASGWDRARLAADPAAPLPSGASRTFAALVRRRARREPVAYLLGRRGFRGVELGVDGRVLIPRPETELLVELALELQPGRVLDVGTGSGAVALAIADELPRAEVLATDVSPDALEVARANAEQIGVAERVRFAEGTIPDMAGRLDLLVANLPYVSTREWESLQPEITEYEPRGALVAGPSGLEAIEAVLGEVSVLERPPSAVALEVGAGQAGPVSELVRRSGYDRVQARRDLAGVERVVLGR